MTIKTPNRSVVYVIRKADHMIRRADHEFTWIEWRFGQPGNGGMVTIDSKTAEEIGQLMGGN